MCRTKSITLAAASHAALHRTKFGVDSVNTQVMHCSNSELPLSLAGHSPRDRLLQEPRGFERDSRSRPKRPTICTPSGIRSHPSSPER